MIPRPMLIILCVAALLSLAAVVWITHVHRVTYPGFSWERWPTTAGEIAR